MHTKVYRLILRRKARKVNTVVNSKHVALGVAIVYMVIGLLVSVMASGVLVTSQSFRTSGVLATANLGVYSDSACTQSLSSFDWGVIAPGASISRNIYVKNIGTAQVTLSLSVSNWNPSAASGAVSVSWNREGLTLTAGEATAAMLTLWVSPSVSGFTGFSVDVFITGTG